MNRTIKFRAKLLKREGDRARGEWVYGLPQQHVEMRGVVNLNKPAEIGYIVSYEPERMLQSGAPDNSLYWYEIDRQTLGEFTGLHDKDGKEIYEGDIIKTQNTPDYRGDNEPYYGQVQYRDQGASFVIVQPHATYTPSLANLLIESKEVIGNVYENHDLMTAHEAQG